MVREQVILEIRRTAAANGGVPLGRRTFERATGIKESAWYGKFWPNWGQALQDAGFSPNAKQPKLDDAFILSKVTELILDLGKFPSTADIRMRCRSEKGFPNEKTIRRLGNRTELAERLLGHCSAREELSQVVRICQSVTASASAPPDEPPTKIRTATQSGAVYLLSAGRHYKIGHTRSVGRRLYELKIQLPYRTKLEHMIQTDDPAGIEAYWHRRFADRRANGEWFALSPDDVSTFKSRKTM